MKGIVKFFALALATFGAQMISTSAMAQVTAPPSGSYSGIVDVKKGLAFKCNLGLTVNATSSTVAVSLTPGNPACASLSFVGNPYSYTFDPATGDFTVVGVYVNTITAGTCTGNITATWDDTTNEFLISTTLPGGLVNGTPTPDCFIEGTAS